MRISTRGRYALRAMVDLAQHGDHGPVLRQELSERQEISADYLAQLFTHLQAAGLVEGIKEPGHVEEVLARRHLSGAPRIRCGRDRLARSLELVQVCRRS